MKLAILCSFLFLAGAVSSSSVNNIDVESIKAWAVEAKLDIPDWVLDLIGKLPESIQEIIDKIPDIIAAIPGILQQIPAIIAAIIQKIPELILLILEKLPEIIAQIPTAIDIIKEVILLIIEKLPEVIPIILEKIAIILDKIPELIGALKEIFAKIKEVLEGLELPDWFPTLPDLEKPEWWPELPSLPEYNKPEAGSVTSVNQYPSIVQIEVGTGPIWAQGCVGTVLTNYHILSAARCFSGLLYSDRFRRVRAGSSRRYEGGSIVNVERSSIHPDFNNRGKTADVAVIRLQTNLILSNTIQQGSIVSQGFVMPDHFIVTTASWGSTSQGGLIGNRNLYEKDLVSVPQDVCAQRWRIVPTVSVPDNAICIGQVSTSGRNGDIRDVGAPIFYQGIQVGIVSVGFPVGNQHFPVIGTSIGAYTNWIVSNAV